MKKSVAAVAVAILLFAACGKEGTSEDALVAGGPSSTPVATESSGTEATKAPVATADSGTPTTAPEATQAGSSGGTTTPSKTATPGKSSPPKDGRYVYDYSGKATDPTNPAGGQQSFSGELYNEVSHSGNVYTLESTNSESAGRTIVRSRLTDTKLEFLEISVETPIGTYGCKFNPPLYITRFPIKAEKYPTQTFKGEGNACEGSLDITIQGKETVKDAGGTSHETWRAAVNTVIKSDTFTVTQKETRWAAPALGMEVKSNSVQNGEVKSGAFQSKFSATTTSLLKDTP